MIKHQFSKRAVGVLREVNKNHPHPEVRHRAMILLLKSQGMAHIEIAKTLGIVQNTVTRYIKIYVKGGIEGLKQINVYRRPSRLSPFKDVVMDYFRKTPPRTIAQACKEIGRITGVEIGKTQMRAYIKKAGIKYRKVGTIPAKADVEAQRAFYKKTSAEIERSPI